MKLHLLTIDENLISNEGTKLIIRRVSFAKIISQTHSNYTHGILHVFLGLLGLCTFIGLKGKNQISKGELPFKLVYVSSRRWKQSGFHRGGYDGLDRGATFVFIN